MALPRLATVERVGEVRFAEPGVAKEGRAVESTDPRLQSGRSSLTGSKIYPLATTPTSDIGLEGEFAFSSDTKSLWLKGITNWEYMGSLLSEVTESQAKVITPSGATGTIEIAT